MKKKRRPKTIECPKCYGSGKEQPIATGMESAWRINQWMMQQPCPRCEGTGKVLEDKQEKETQP